MLGETRQNNDVYIFFENDEIERLRHEKIQGTYFNFKNPSKTCSLDASIDNEMRDRIKTSGEKNEEGFFTRFHIKINLERYETLVEKRTSGIHEGFRHIELLDASNMDNLDFGDRFGYRQLKHYESQYSR
ncbi:MAG: hypothetical protein GQ477_01340 [Nanohaloarchaea archaeon]|nr:hypothetical protein [Candidatus Nanohaloarchaea archaeon]